MTVTFNGSNSTDAVGIKSYVWNFTDITQKIILKGVHPTYRFRNVGNFTVMLNVTNYAGLWDTDTMWVYVSADTTPPSIGPVSQEPSVPGDGVPVTITVNVTDTQSGVCNVTISYKTNSGPWANVSMSKLTGDAWDGEIPGLPGGTNVTYKIIAYDNAGNLAVNDNAGHYYLYTVVPEFPAAIVLPLFIIATLVAAFLGKKKRTPKS
jgi:PKD repeat protein